MKIRLTKKQLIELINEDIGSFEHTQGTVHWLLNKPKCAAYLDKNALPDSFLAIFFGDQMIGAGAELSPMINQSFLNKAISQDTIMSKLQSPDAVARANKPNFDWYADGPEFGNELETHPIRAVETEYYFPLCFLHLTSHLSLSRCFSPFDG